MDNIVDNLLNFINKTPESYNCIKNIKEILKQNDFIELFENDIWDNVNTSGNYFVSRNDSSIIAFKLIPSIEKSSFNIVVSHTDSPSFKIKTNPEIFENKYLKLNIAGYGGLINYSWLDRPLSFAGRIITSNKTILEKHIINIDKDLLIIPSEAIHINDKVNENCKLNIQYDMLPILSLNNQKFNRILENYLNSQKIGYDKIYDYDLFLYNRNKAKVMGLNDEFILAPRLDDLASVYISLISFINSTNNNSFNLFCSLDNEEIGSLSQQGADSTFLINIISRIVRITNHDLTTSLSNSFILNVDNTHAIHPNAPLKNDPTNKVYLNKGVVIGHDINLTTDALTSTIFKRICESVNVPFQDYVPKSDMDSGCTQGTINQSHVGVDSIDIGLAQLSMHSANELIGSIDVLYLYKVLLQFYKSKIIKDKNYIKLI